MSYVLITSAAILLCSLAGAAVGFCFADPSERLDDVLSGSAAGIMLCAAVLGLVVPAAELAGDASVWLPAVGIVCGVLFLMLLGRCTPFLAGKIGMSGDSRGSALAFVAAIAIHHLPEGIAAGVSFGTGELSDAITVVSGIALQNIPEGMIIIPPLLQNGAGRKKAAFTAFVSAFVEVIGVALGYFAVTLSKAILPFALAFAAGTMLFVITDDMIPNHKGRLASLSLLAGFCAMLSINSLF